MARVAEIVSDSELHLRGVVVGDERRRVRWVAVSELADPAPFLEGGELVLTTGLETKAWDQEWNAYVCRLIEANAAAIGFGVGLTHRRIPAELIRACQTSGMNLIEVPRATSFVSISRRVARLLERDEIDVAKQIVGIQRRLTTAAAKGDSTRAVVKTLGRYLDAACLLDPDGEPVVAAAGPRASELAERSLSTEMPRLRGRGPRISVSLSTSHGSTIAIHPVGLGRRTRSYLATLTSGRIDEPQRSAIAAALALLGLIAEQERQQVEAFLELRTKAVELLLSGELPSARMLLEASAAASSLPSRLRIIVAHNDQDDVAEWVERMAQRRVLAAIINGQLCAAVAPTMAKSLAAELVGSHFSVGIGAVVDVAEAHVSFSNAKAALAQVGNSSGLVSWDDVVRHGPLSLIDPEALVAFASHALGGLDEGQQTLLRVFLRNNGSRGKVAAELGLHRNTVQNRLAVIEAHLGANVDDPQTRVTAWIALQALDRTTAPSPHTFSS